mmetsp:Transcript_26518/g.32245  ORF Transcript_26518/g.32245 Transcript_26518/m.32245 type:complete len:205 (+) Transcript_26518:1601-2215(+)
MMRHLPRHQQIWNLSHKYLQSWTRCGGDIAPASPYQMRQSSPEAPPTNPLLVWSLWPHVERSHPESARRSYDGLCPRWSRKRSFELVSSDVLKNLLQSWSSPRWMPKSDHQWFASNASWSDGSPPLALTSWRCGPGLAPRFLWSSARGHCKKSEPSASFAPVVSLVAMQHWQECWSPAKEEDWLEHPREPPVVNMRPVAPVGSR